MPKTNRSPYASHPLVGWQLLRRNQLYKSMVKEVQGWIEHSGNEKLKFSMELIREHSKLHYNDEYFAPKEGLDEEQLRTLFRFPYEIDKKEDDIQNFFA